MGLFDRLFRRAPDPSTAERLFPEGRARFWAGEMDPAEDLLSRAALGHAKPAPSGSFGMKNEGSARRIPCAA